MDGAQDLGLEAALDEEARVQGELGRAHDYLEGVAAFAERRTPGFGDR
jgi:2-(1,2-epoxy-1,2-dihydrophenyl)acetyl-CoA isomerase